MTHMARTTSKLSADQRALRAALAQADKYKKRASELESAIRQHFKQVHAGNWGYDDDLWSKVGLLADPEVLG